MLRLSIAVLYTCWQAEFEFFLDSADFSLYFSASFSFFFVFSFGCERCACEAM